MVPNTNLHRAAIALALAGLLIGCASNRFSSLSAGLDEQTVRQKVGPEADRIERDGYVLSLHEKSPSEYYFLKFEGGKLVNRGTLPKWILHSDNPYGPRKTLAIRDNYTLSSMLLKNGLTVEGLALMKRYIADNPDSNGSEVFLGHLYLQAKLPDSAIAIQRRAIASAKDDTARSAHQGNLLGFLCRSRRLDEGEAFAKEVLSDTSMPSILKYGIRYNLACLYSIQNRKALAIEQLRLAVDLNSDLWTQRDLDGDKDFDTIRTEPGFLAVRARLKPGKKGNR